MNSHPDGIGQSPIEDGLPNASHVIFPGGANNPSLPNPSRTSFRYVANNESYEQPGFFAFFFILIYSA